MRSPLAAPPVGAAALPLALTPVGGVTAPPSDKALSNPTPESHPLSAEPASPASIEVAPPTVFGAAAATPTAMGAFFVDHKPDPGASRLQSDFSAATVTLLPVRLTGTRGCRQLASSLLCLLVARSRLDGSA